MSDIVDAILASIEGQSPAPSMETRDIEQYDGLTRILDAVYESLPPKPTWDGSELWLRWKSTEYGEIWALWDAGIGTVSADKRWLNMMFGKKD